MAKISFKVKDEISQTRLKKIWDSEFKDKPFPNDIRAFVQTTKQYIKTANMWEKSRYGVDTSEQEWGEKLQPNQTQGYIRFKDKDPKAYTLIFIKDNAWEGIDEVLKHELKHVYDGEEKTRELYNLPELKDRNEEKEG